MPFLWKKKNRVTRISQIVADFQSPKRGTSSLVVQTGFPTSLIDLFVKNRNRFKKSSFKKPFRSEIIDPSSSPSPPPPPPPSPVTFQQPISESPIHEIFSEEIPMSNPPISETVAADEESAAVDFVTVNKLGSAMGSNSKMITVKMLTVIILAASVKELTVAITVSAFALLFLENALNFVVSNIKPKSRFQKVLFRSKENEVYEPVTVFAGDEIELLNLDSNFVSNLDSNYCVNDEIEVVEEKNELENSLKIRGKGNRSGRFKATMVKKLQKFRGSRKEKKEEKEIINIINKENISCVVDEEKEEIINIKNEVRDDDCGITRSRETIVVVGNSSYAILVMVVLVGLIVGRLQALILTIGWCFLVKIVGGLWRSKNVGFIKGYVSRCS